ncbi:hypothetical protein GOP47_0004098 [Adiantum capillus-veneris]|uniref:Uncharacterized protein n=1 Tax=Adiantum capillus-veneris TaxID=13818 RepID=A0A9D4V7K0_ADICA|nr:hypothetical protein GOP47_0004098 [Adiantum capillus-veneris]
MDWQGQQLAEQIMHCCSTCRRTRLGLLQSAPHAVARSKGCSCRVHLQEQAAAGHCHKEALLQGLQEIVQGR